MPIFDLCNLFCGFKFIHSYGERWDTASQLSKFTPGLNYSYV